MSSKVHYRATASLPLCFVVLGLQSQGALAQSAAGQIVPQQSTVDKNGVDLGSGLWSATVAHLSIGEPGRGMEWSQPTNGQDNLSAILIYGPGGHTNAGNDINLSMAGNAGDYGSDGDGTTSDSCQGSGAADWAQANDSQMLTSGLSCNSLNSQVQINNRDVGITIFYLGKAAHFYGIWNWLSIGGTPGQTVYFTEMRQPSGNNSFSCVLGNVGGNFASCKFTAHDGTVLNFPAFQYSLAPSGQSQTPGVYQANNVVKPDGEVLTYYGSSSRIPGDGWAPTTSGGTIQIGGSQGFSPFWLSILKPAAIVSNRGYTLKYLWDGTSVTDVFLYNTNQESCAPTASQCSFAHSWPNVHFSYGAYNSSTGQFTLNVKDAVGNTRQFATNFWMNSGAYTSYPLTLKVTDPLGDYRSLTFDTNYIGLGLADDNFGKIGNVSPPTLFNTQHVTSYFDGSATWNYAYNYIYYDTGALGGCSGTGCAGFYNYFYLDLQTTRTDPNGGVRTVTSIPTGTALTDVDELGRKTTYSIDMPTYGWIGAYEGRINSVQYPNGSSTTYNYGGNNSSISSVVDQQVPGTPPVGSGGTNLLKTTYNYPSSSGCQQASGVAYLLCNSPTSEVDRNGNETDFTYDPTHGGILTKTLPPDANGVRPQARYHYTQMTASGQSGPIWVLQSTSSCASATSANPASCVGTAQETVTTYTYDPANLWLASVTVAQGDGSNSRTTSYTHDLVGNITSTTDPNGNVSYTTYDALRRKVFEIGADPDGTGPLPRPIVHHVYDADGHETRTEVGTGFNTDGSDFALLHHKQMTYDPATGRLTQIAEIVP